MLNWEILRKKVENKLFLSLVFYFAIKTLKFKIEWYGTATSNKNYSQQRRQRRNLKISDGIAN